MFSIKRTQTLTSYYSWDPLEFEGIQKLKNPLIFDFFRVYKYSSGGLKFYNTISWTLLGKSIFKEISVQDLAFPIAHYH